jgi:hypothetical protein
MPKADDFSLPAGTTVMYLGFEPLKGPGQYSPFFQDPVRLRAGRLTETYTPGSSFILDPTAVFSDPNAHIAARDTKVAPLLCENGARFYVIKRNRPDRHGVSVYMVLEDVARISEDEVHVITVPRRIKVEIHKAYMEHALDLQKML